MRIPNHIGIIPDGNRRWAIDKGLSKESGYESGIDPGLLLFKLCEKLGIKEITYYGFTVDNTKRPREQIKAFTEACINSVNILSKENAELLVVGNTKSPMFPKELLPYTTRRVFGKGGMKVNFLVNYSWKWDLEHLKRSKSASNNITNQIQSYDVSKMDLIIRWGGRRRLSGFLPVQSIYSDFYIIEDYWPNFKEKHFYDAINWYDTQDITLGG
ncbi:undecaprenyl diphosphate synthase family protein [Clostridium algidicarnis]|uniref:undecaprenyl diphosphate synthase family protein n=1 Tax=Clostridium algidicarnis TaxID=37659 RepID=UPI001C0D1903|nr:undecaprenyl diphosphate synthase family protein [Clostridium algidicarnis]MBU3210319.1 undecaprenyl diphosphate synthase family protein [Clostridium algidicarnis]MBU3228291.1 undecaprenyl diphosphate synthase family protein [Clostridium algidicarnis]MBU3251348.1 undecaprenyl diphosphate synthase family protein [Clostridium algidicarnis]